MNYSKSGRRYDREFKGNAVALVRGRRTRTAVARDLGVSKWSLREWVRQAKNGQSLSEPKTLAQEPRNSASCGDCGRNWSMSAVSETF